MLSIILFFFLMSFIVFFLFFLSMFFKKSNENAWSDLAFECGFEPNTSKIPPFSLQFFSITIVFLIFDLEIIILVPLFVTETSSHTFFLKLFIMIFILLGLLVEWYDGSLDWDLN